MKIFFKISNLILLIISFLWLCNRFNWESSIATLTLSITFLYHYIKDITRNNISKSDVKLFNEITSLISQSTINYLNEKSMDQLIEKSMLRPIYQFRYNCNGINFNFIDNKIEKEKEDFKKNIIEFLDELGPNFYNINFEEYKVLRERFSSDEEYLKLIKKLSILQDNIVNQYNEFIKIAKKRLLL